jgi:hypothetical protein
MTNFDFLDQTKLQFKTQFSLGACSATEIVTFFEGANCNITWMKEFDVGRIWCILIKPYSRSLIDGFGLHQEVMVICTGYTNFHARTLKYQTEIINAIQTQGRIQDDLLIILSPDPSIAEILSKIEEAGQVLIGISPEEISKKISSGQVSEGFRHILQERLYARDFFDKSGPVQGSDFFGRHKLIQDISVQLGRGSHVGLYGLRKIGKTSVIKQLIEKKDIFCASIFFIHIDLLSIAPINRNIHYLFYSMIKSLSSMEFPGNTSYHYSSFNKNRRFDEIRDFDSFERAFDDDFKSILATFSNQGKRLVIILDEIERLFPILEDKRGFQGYEHFLEYVRGISQSSLPLSIFVVGVNPHISEAQYLGKRQNPMFGFLVNRYAPPLTLDEVKDMVKILGRSSGASFAHDAIELIFNFVGGHPYLVRRYCSLAIKDTARPVHVTKETIESLKENFLRTETSIFAEMVSVVKEFYPDEFQVLHKISEEGDIKSESVNRRILAHLEGYQLVETENGVIRFKYKLMNEWMQGVTRRVAAEISSPLVMFKDKTKTIDAIDEELVYDKVKALEIGLRKLIRKVLEQRWGAKAEERIKLSIGKIDYDKAKERQENSKRLRSEDELLISEILEYLYIGDMLKILIGNEWQEFRDMFVDKKELERNLGIVATSRNELQHFRKMPNTDLLRAYLASIDVLSKLS